VTQLFNDAGEHSEGFQRVAKTAKERSSKQPPEERNQDKQQQPKHSRTKAKHKEPERLVTETEFIEFHFFLICFAVRANLQARQGLPV
jgi:hypothetical protein